MAPRILTEGAHAESKPQLQPRHHHKADVSVDTVNTQFGRTNRANVPIASVAKVFFQKAAHRIPQGHVVPVTPDHEQVLATPDQPDRTGTRNYLNPTTAGGRTPRQGLEPATHTPEQATAAARPQTAHQRQGDATTSYVHTLKQKPL
jgi:hypothetical protein